LAENKTQATPASVADFIAGIADAQRRADCEALVALMGAVTGAPAVMWGPAIVGFGRYHYRYASGREGDSFRVGFSPRKANLTLYIMPGFDTFEALLAGLGPHTTGSSCLYIKGLARVDAGVLRTLIERSVAWMAERYPDSPA